MPILNNDKQQTYCNADLTIQGIVTAQDGAKQSSMMIVTYEVKGYHGAHYHDEEQILMCLEGEGLLYLEKDARVFSIGQTALIPAGMKHALLNTGHGLLRVAAFAPSAMLTTHWLTRNRRASPRAPFVRNVFESNKIDKGGKGMKAAANSGDN